MTRTMQSFSLLCAFALVVPTAASAEGMLNIADGVGIQCRATVGNSDKGWLVELDSSVPLAVVDSHDVPAEYSPSHARVRLALDGPALVIGLKTGRLLVTDATGKGIGFGQCQPPLMTVRGKAEAHHEMRTERPETIYVSPQFAASSM